MLGKARLLPKTNRKNNPSPASVIKIATPGARSLKISTSPLCLPPDDRLQTKETPIMADQQTRARTFRALHTSGYPIVLFNVWDPGSAKAVEAAGAAALATGSWSVAAAFGQSDGEQLALTLALDNLARIVATTDLPVSIDLESGYGEDPAGVGCTVAAA